MAYSVAAFGAMLADSVRMDAYAHALKRVVRPDSIVVDIGAGTGILSLIAARLGAKRVYAVEPDDVIELARQSAAANGFAERIETIQGLSTDIELPERATIIVSDMRGILPLAGRHLPSVIDARRRLLAPGGVLLSAKDLLWGAVVADPGSYDDYVEPYRTASRSFDLELERGYAANGYYTPKEPSAVEFLTVPDSWAEIDYTAIESPNCSGTLSSSATKPGTAHGISLWFEARVHDEIGFSTAPNGPTTVYRNAFFPLVEPVHLEADDVVDIAIDARLVGDDYVWRWDTRVSRAGRTVASFRQSTFFGTPIAPSRLVRRAPSHKVKLDDRGNATRMILDLMDGTRTNEAVAATVFEAFPAAFRSKGDALHHVAKLAEKYAS